jgi:hypothetical protein
MLPSFFAETTMLSLRELLGRLLGAERLAMSVLLSLQCGFSHRAPSPKR